MKLEQIEKDNAKKVKEQGKQERLQTVEQFNATIVKLEDNKELLVKISVLKCELAAVAIACKL